MQEKYPYTQEFKARAIQYVADHPELSVKQCANNFGVSTNSLRNWIAQTRKEGTILIPQRTPGASKFTPEFKEWALQYVADHPALTFKQCAKDLGVHYNTLSNWIAQARKEGTILIPQRAPRASKFTPEFKARVIQHVANHPELTIAQCAKDLGVNKGTLRHWIAQARKEGTLQGRQYTPEFKARAIQHVANHPELTIAQCAKDFGVNKGTLRHWIAQARKEGTILIPQRTPGASKFTPEFKEWALQYVADHPALTFKQCAKDLGVNRGTLRYWICRAHNND